MNLKKTKKILSLLFTLIIIFLLLGPWISPVLYIVSIILTVVYVCIYMKYWRCPRCGKILGRGIIKRCLNCGEDVGICIRF